MSRIAHVCKCLFEKSLVHLATNFENEYFTNAISVDHVLSQFKKMIPEYLDFFATTYHDIITMYDGDSYFLVCGKCLLKLFEMIDIYIGSYINNDEGHGSCIPILSTFFYERIYENKVWNYYIFHYWDLCKQCTKSFLNTFKVEFHSVYHLNIS